MSHTPYTITDRDEYGVNHAVLTFDSPQQARDYLRGLLDVTDNTAIETALQAELEEVEAVLDAEAP